MQLTAITHIYNEEFLLPFWLRHHRQIFDHGVVIDYNSTDRSREIFDELAPKGWEWIPSRDALFFAEGCDQQVMEQERRFLGWKMALNITEFLFHPNPKAYLERLCPTISSIWTKTYMMVDRVEDRSREVRPRTPLVMDRFYGMASPDGWGRERLIHCYPDGQYYPGRHRSNHPAINRDDLILLWFNYAPFDLIKRRKLQIQQQLPKSDIDLGRGHHHILTEEQLEDQYLDISSRVINLLTEDEAYQDNFLEFVSKRPTYE